MPAPFRQSYKYAYPNNRSYTQIDYSTMQPGPGYEGQPLRHGFIYGYKQAPVTGATDPAATAASSRVIDWNNSKMFQFNPPELSIGVTLIASENQAAQAPGGHPTGIGLASTTLEMYFNRTMEVNTAMSGRGDSIWGDLGVQVDLFDVLRVISGGVNSNLFTGDTPNTDSPFGGTIRQESLNKLTGMFYDAVMTGSNVQFLSFALVFNPNLSVHVQRMTSFGFGFLQFTKDLVPTTMKIQMGLDISNMGSSAYVTSGGAAGATGRPVGTAPPGTTAEPLRPIQGSF